MNNAPLEFIIDLIFTLILWHLVYNVANLSGGFGLVVLIIAIILMEIFLWKYFRSNS